MGRCWKCDTELRLAEDEWLCDNCGKIVGYRCWKCKKDFEVRDGNSHKKLPECNFCGDFFCPHCGSCKEDCPKITHERTIFNILGGQVKCLNGNLDMHLVVDNYETRIKRVVDYMINKFKEPKLQKICPYGVYQSYARGTKDMQGRIKQLLAKISGHGVKGKLDMDGFNEKLNRILNLIEGQETTVEKIRDNGRYGQEERDALNLGICLRQMSARPYKNKNGETGIIYKKIKYEGISCHYLRNDNLITKKCPNCNLDYNNPKLVELYNPNTSVCPKCVYVKGKNKGKNYTLKIRQTNTFICNCPYKKYKIMNDYINKNEVEEDE